MIVLLLSRLEHGGLERVQLNLATELSRRGHTVEIWVGRRIANSAAELPAGVAFREIATDGRVFFPYRLARMLTSKRPATVFTTANDLACVMVLLRKVLRLRTKVVVTQHLSLSAPRRLARGLRRLKLQVLSFLMRHLYPRADQLIAVSNAVANDMQIELGLEPESIRVIHNPIVLPTFDDMIRQAVPWPWPDHRLPTIVFVGRLSLEKRLDLLLESFVRVRRHVDCRLLIVGTGDQVVPTQRSVERNGLSEHCKLVGFSPNPLPYIKASTVLALCSDYEGFGNVLVEAMACGTQVVSTDCPDGPAEVIAHGKYGQLVPPGDMDALVAALLGAVTGEIRFSPPDLRRRANEFNLARAVDAYAEVANSLNAGNVGAGRSRTKTEAPESTP